MNGVLMVCPPQIDNLKDISTKIFPWWINKINKGEVIKIEDVSKMPSEAKAEKEILESQDIKSLLVFPVRIAGKTKGFMGFDNVKSTGKWSNRNIDLLNLVSGFIGRALEQSKSIKIIEDSKDRFKVLVEVAPIPMFVSSLPDGRILFANDSCSQLMNVPTEKLIGRVTSDFYFNLSDRLEILKKIKEQGFISNKEICIKKDDGTFIMVEISSKLATFSGANAVFTCLIDLTNRKLNEKKITEALGFNEKIINESPIGISIYDASGKCIAANNSIAKIIGANKQQVLEQNYNYIESWKKSGLIDKAKSAISEGIIKRHEVATTSSFGRKVSLDCHLVPFKFEGEERLLLMINDITERLELDEYRMQTEATVLELTQLIDTANAPIFGVDKEGNINEWNKTTEEITGYQKEEVLGRNLVDNFITKEYKVAVKNVLDKALKGEQTSNYELPLYSKAGKRIMVLLNATTRRDSEGNITGGSRHRSGYH